MKKLYRERHGAFSDEEGVNPMHGVANLADVMLVLVVGFMLALVVNWNIDIASAAFIKTPDPEVRDAMPIDGEDIEQVRDEAEQIDSEGMEKLGTVYYDDVSGKYYIIAE